MTSTHTHRRPAIFIANGPPIWSPRCRVDEPAANDADDVCDHWHRFVRGARARARARALALPPPAWPEPALPAMCRFRHGPAEPAARAGVRLTFPWLARRGQLGSAAGVWAKASRRPHTV